MIDKKRYFDNFFETVIKYDNPINMIKRWKADIRDLQKDKPQIPSYYKIRGKYQRVSRRQEIHMLRDWIREFEYRI